MPMLDLLETHPLVGGVLPFRHVSFAIQMLVEKPRITDDSFLPSIAEQVLLLLLELIGKKLFVSHAGGESLRR
jgi:hypothetical protein